MNKLNLRKRLATSHSNEYFILNLSFQFFYLKVFRWIEKAVSEVVAT